MRPRKVAAVVVEEPPPSEDAVDVSPPDDIAADEPVSFAGAPLSAERICVDCGSHGGAYDGCAHRERARFHAPSRSTHELVARLRRAAAEHRAAARALRTLALAEHARGRADIETAAEEEPEEPPPEAAPPEPPPAAVCPRCAAQAEGEPTSTPTPATSAPAQGEDGGPLRRPKRKGRVPLEQQAFPFTSDPEQQPPRTA
ncbi:hypothetical protein SOCE26_019050 [Sorangium cellulosum]|uniref:Uncharacterized protein n=1 Tax=Sorangium cellulosum TaxID=56 RepID=A0A2L0EMH2_SORCE|nr:hypothetical protein [Sorangium cellulosum]AUX40504.1 hypothetical protein SOCE26_019050 [Sorangium cellulosum]